MKAQPIKFTCANEVISGYSGFSYVNDTGSRLNLLGWDNDNWCYLDGRHGAAIPPSDPRDANAADNPQDLDRG